MSSNEQLQTAAEYARRARTAGTRAVGRVTGLTPRFARLHERIDESDRRLAECERSLAELREQMSVLQWDLNESRRLNLRAAELLDIVADEAARRGLGS